MKISKKKFDVIVARKCLTMQEVATMANVPYVTLRKATSESCKYTLPITAGKIARALDVDVTEIIED